MHLLSKFRVFSHDLRDYSAHGRATQAKSVLRTPQLVQYCIRETKMCLELLFFDNLREALGQLHLNHTLI